MSMSGIVFLKCADLEKTREFYTGILGMKVWLEQPDISILQHGNMLLGFHSAGSVDKGCLITFFYETRGEVDAMHEKLKATAMSRPKVNDKYRIYNFFARDPEGRDIEFQAFLHPLQPLCP